jgi:hypothetical protein
MIMAAVPPTTAIANGMYIFSFQAAIKTILSTSAITRNLDGHPLDRREFRWSPVCETIAMQRFAAQLSSSQRVDACDSPSKMGWLLR